MSLITLHGNWIAVSSGPKVFIFSEKNDPQITLELPPPKPPVKENKPAAKEAASEGTKNVVMGLRFSPCGNWLAVYSSAKQLLVWMTSDWSLGSEREMPKAGSSMKFTPKSSAVIIVDKAGDAVLFSIQDLVREGEIILGHLSMLLDVELTPDGKLVITCDRDEKIRVSHFPNAYNIVSYCLGHKEFVSSVCLLPHDSSLLVSSSGDGTLRLWDYLNGKAVATRDCASDVTRELTKDPSCFTDVENENQSSIIVKKVFCLKANDNSSLACALFYGYQGCLVYSVLGKRLEFLQVLCPTEMVADLCSRSSGQIIVRKNKAVGAGILHCYTLDSGSNRLSSEPISTALTVTLSKINEFFSTLDECVPPTNVPHLVKRKFDNVKDYYEQKKARVGEC